MTTISSRDSLILSTLGPSRISRGNRGRDSETKRSVLLAVGSTDRGQATFMKAQAVDHVDHDAVEAFDDGIDTQAEIHADGFAKV